MDSLFSIRDKVALVTGSSKGIGFSLAAGSGYFLTELTRPLSEDPAFDAWLKERTPAGRWGTPDELIGTLIYLSSEASKYINGQIIYVDGGVLATI